MFGGAVVVLAERDAFDGGATFATVSVASARGTAAGTTFASAFVVAGCADGFTAEAISARCAVPTALLATDAAVATPQAGWGGCATLATDGLVVAGVFIAGTKAVDFCETAAGLDAAVDARAVVGDGATVCDAMTFALVDGTVVADAATDFVCEVTTSGALLDFFAVPEPEGCA